MCVKRLQLVIARLNTPEPSLQPRVRRSEQQSLAPSAIGDALRNAEANITIFDIIRNVLSQPPRDLEIWNGNLHVKTTTPAGDEQMRLPVDARLLFKHIPRFDVAWPQFLRFGTTDYRRFDLKIIESIEESALNVWVFHSKDAPNRDGEFRRLHAHLMKHRLAVLPEFPAVGGPEGVFTKLAATCVSSLVLPSSVCRYLHFHLFSTPTKTTSLKQCPTSSNTQSPNRSIGLPPQRFHQIRRKTH